MQKNDFFKKMLVFGTIVLFFGAVVIPSISSISNHCKSKNIYTGAVAFNPFKEGWKYRKQITIDHTKVAGNLASFPVLVSTIDSDLRDKAQVDGDDILFMDDKGEANQLFHEIEYFDSFSGELVAWVNIPILSSAIDVVFYMYYGNPDCIGQEFPELVWDSNYIHVWHLGDNLEDSVGYNDGIDHGTSIVTGKIGESRNFEKNERDYISFGDMAQPGDGSLTTMTWEAWVKPETIDEVGCIITTKYNSQGPDYASYFIVFLPDGRFKNTVFSAWDVTTNSITNYVYGVVGQWTYFTSTFNLGGINDIVPFIDGIEVSDTQITSSGNYMCDIPVDDDLGRWRTESGTIYSDEVIDELRWSKIIRSDEWIKTSYSTMNDPSSFLGFGLEEKPRQKAYDNILFYWFLECFPLLERLLSLFRVI
jgi:hypothetical protein